MQRLARAALIAAALLAPACARNAVPPEAVTSNIIGNPDALAGQPLAGFQPFDTQVRPTWDERRTASTYPRPEGAEGPRLYLEEASVVPKFATPGGAIRMLVQYAVLDAGAGADATEVRQLLRDGEVVAELSRATELRSAGTYISTQQCLLPYTIPRGEYAIRQTVQLGAHTVTAESAFTVGSR